MVCDGTKYASTGWLLVFLLSIKDVISIQMACLFFKLYLARYKGHYWQLLCCGILRCQGSNLAYKPKHASESFDQLLSCKYIIVVMGGRGGIRGVGDGH